MTSEVGRNGKTMQQHELEPGESRPIQVGVIGVGYWGANHLRVFANMEGVSVTAIDADGERARAAAWPYRAAWASSLDQVVDQLDAVVVATPPASHYRLARQAIEAGCHLLVEKPLTTNTADGEALVNSAAEAGVVLMTGHTFLSNPAVIALRDIVRGEDFGGIKLIDSARLNLGIHQRDVNVLWDLAPHDISIMNYLVGECPNEVSAWPSAGPDTQSDAAYLRMKYPSGVVGTIHVSWLHPTKVRRTSVVGERMMAVYDDLAEHRVSLHDRRSDAIEQAHRYHIGDTVLPAIDAREPLVVQAEEFLRCVRTGETPRADGRAGLDIVRVLCAADLSLANHTGVLVDEAQVPGDASSLGGGTNGHGPHVVDALQQLGYTMVPSDSAASVMLVGPDSERVEINLDTNGIDLRELSEPSHRQGINGWLRGRRS